LKQGGKIKNLKRGRGGYIENIRKFKPDILLLIDGFGIIKEPLLKITPLGVLSYHHGNMQKYRGEPPAFLELYNNENEMGITVQILSSGLEVVSQLMKRR
jgi:methionyl-tRNA formyltransferase